MLQAGGVRSLHCNSVHAFTRLHVHDLSIRTPGKALVMPTPAGARPRSGRSQRGFFVCEGLQTWPPSLLHATSVA